MADKRLGKGLEALISSYSTDNGGRYVDGAVPIDQIIPNRNQPRQEFNTEQMEELTASIKATGILQPLTVREIGDNEFEVPDGYINVGAAEMNEILEQYKKYLRPFSLYPYSFN